MSLPFELVGTACPDPLVDPIEFHVWHEAHRCDKCKGIGYTWHDCCDCDEDEGESCKCCRLGLQVAIDCEDCEGTGFIGNYDDED